MQLTILPLTGIEEITPGTDLAQSLLQSLEKNEVKLMEYDVLIITQKIVSKSEGAFIDLTSITPSSSAKNLAKQGNKSAAYYEAVLGQTKRIVRKGHGVIICETHHGFICANAGVDESNVKENSVTILPDDPDASARNILQTLQKQTKVNNLAVIISDTWGRTWREGQTNMAIGVAGMNPLHSYIGKKDRIGHNLTATTIAVADELAAAAELVMNKTDNVPAALIRGYQFEAGNGSIRSLIMNPKKDLFR